MHPSYNLQFYQNLIAKFKNYIKNEICLDDMVKISCRALTASEAIGNPKRKDYPLLTGKEVLLEADYNSFKGQAFTDSPSNFSGSVRDILNLDINKTNTKAILTATINAVTRSINDDLDTIHCKDEEPLECAASICEFLVSKGYRKLLMIGFQPAIADALKAKFELILLDRNKENIGKVKNDIFIEDGYSDNKFFYNKVDAVLATGSTIVNGSIVEIIQNSNEYNKDLYFYGTTIAAPAFLLGLKRLCFSAH